ncbi:Integrase core domain-containing protein [Nitrosomonas communis]|uniref:Integrase core domain-containing protein n=2 Tax=Nitrosomonas communis TaxID=44574 RepID=A0A1I4RKL1_9PROT|nr:Integrase core domain-containing protein [Nitrosomonas communis]
MPPASNKHLYWMNVEDFTNVLPIDESLNGTLRDNMLNGEIFHGVHEVQAIMNQWASEVNTIRRHSVLGYQPPALEAGFALSS